MSKPVSNDLQRKIERIEALYRRPGTPGEKQAAAIALNRLRGRLHALETYRKVEIKEYEFTVFREV